MTPNKQEMPPQIRHQTTYFLTPILWAAAKEMKNRNFLKYQIVVIGNSKKVNLMLEMFVK